MPLLNDFRQALRSLLRQRLFSASVIAITALGIGANAAVFAVVYTILLRDLPFQAPEQLGIVTEASQTFDTGLASPTAYLEWRGRNRVFSKLAAFMWWENSTLGEGLGDQPLLTVTASKDFFDVLGVKPLLGRTFSEDEIRRGVSSAVILSYDVWQRRFGGDPNVIGRIIKNGKWSMPIVGVMPPGPVNLEIGWGDVWHPLRLRLEYNRTETSDTRYIRVVGRIQPGLNLDRARAGLTVVQRQLQRERPEVFAGYEVRIATLRDTLAGEFRPASLILLAVTGCLLLLACASLANMLVARSAAHEKELAVRVALGATQASLVARLLMGNLVLTAIGAVRGLFVCLGTISALAWFEPGIRALLGTHLIYSRPVAGVCAALALITAAVVTVPVALGLKHMSVHESLKEGGRSGMAGVRRQRIRGLLVSIEVALALSLLIVSALLAKSFVNLMRIDLGFQSDHVLALEMNVGEGSYGSGEKRRAYYRPLIRTLAGLPGVTSVGGLRYFPMHARLLTATIQTEANPQNASRRLTVYGNNIAGDYFKTMRIPLISGRLPSEQELWETGNVALVNATAARILFADGAAVGKRILMEGRYREVIGIVGDVRQEGLGRPTRPEFYHTMADGEATGILTIAIRTEGPPETYIRAVRSAVQRSDPFLSTPVVTPLSVFLSETVAARRTAARLGSGFAVLSLVLAAMGIYGLISYWVTQRTAEIGIRMALGASQSSVVRLVVGHGLQLAGVGIAAGLAISLLVARMMSSFLYGVATFDPLTFGLAPLVLFLVALLAASWPAVRAIRINPVEALRSE
jgi:putative ABC transport system permease protein